MFRLFQNVSNAFHFSLMPRRTAMASAKFHYRYLLYSQSALFGISGTSTFIFRRGDIEAIAQGEADKTCIVVLNLCYRHAVEIERSVAYALIKEVVT